MQDERSRYIAGEFLRARLVAQALDGFPGAEVPPDLQSAYRCQQAAIDGFPDTLAGWKVAKVPPVFRERYNEERLIGPVFARNVHYAQSGAAVDCPVFAGGFAAVEAEVGIVVKHDAAPGRTDWNSRSVVELVDRVCAGIEVASSPLATLDHLGPGAVVADFGNNWGVIQGAQIADWATRGTPVDVATWIDDALVGRASVKIAEGPLDALAFVANKAASLGRPLRAGAYITTGMLTGVHGISIGQQARVLFEGCGELRCRFVRATAGVMR